jgi:alkylation response protein AidB-like acyl-CoA dehydrogenase
MDEQTYRAALRDFLAREVAPHVEEWERSQFFPRDVVRELGRAGFFAPCLRPTARGQAIPLDIRFFSVLIEELALTRCFGLTLTISIHVGVFLPLVQRLAQPAIRDQLVTAALRGAALGTIAITEAGSAGSDFMGIESCAEFQADRIVLSGHKSYITNAAVADYVIVFARHQPGRHFTNFCALLVPTDRPGVRSARLEMAVMRTAVISEIAFDQVTLDPSALLGRKQLGMSYFLQHIAVERLSGGIWALAVAEHCLEQAQRMTVRRQIGAETLWERSSVRHQIAQAVAQVTLLRALVEKVVAEMDRSGIVDPFQSAVLKAAVAPMMEQVIGLCVQLQGARGLTAHSSLLRLLNEFRVFGVAGGSVETMLDVISESWAQRAAQAAEAELAVHGSAAVSLT